MEHRTRQNAAENQGTEQGQTKDAMQIDVPVQPTGTAKSTPLQPDMITDSLETRKLGYIHLANGAQPRSQSSVSPLKFI